MLEFRPIRLEDQAWIQQALRQSDFQGCEYSFANNLAWCRSGNVQIAKWEGFYISRSDGETPDVPVFTFPAGSGDYQAVFRELAAYASERQVPLYVRGVTPQVAPILESLFPGQYTLTPQRDEFDYIYRTEDLITLKGKKYHKKRNHLKQFQQYASTFSLMTPDDFDDCIAFSASFYNEKEGYLDPSSVAEQYAIHTFFTHFKTLGLQGGVLRVDGKLVAFTIGEPLNQNTYGVHIEKADVQYQGAYPAINQAFVEAVAASYAYVNREEDLGWEGLRQAKESYYPAILLEKATAVFPHPEQIEATTFAKTHGSIKT